MMREKKKKYFIDTVRRAAFVIVRVVLLGILQQRWW